MILFCLCLIVMCIFVIVIGIITVHNLPGKIARERGHPQAEAIHICSLLGLIVFPLWMAALIWAYIVPVLSPVELSNANADSLHRANEEGQS
ncbi:MAG: DUF3302 domain-containing protein [bacterium]